MHCYAIARDDAIKVERVLWVSYEAFVARPHQELTRIVQFLGLQVRTGWTAAPRDDNAKYFDLWCSRYFPESDRAIEQLPPERDRGFLTRAKERLARKRRESALPLHRQREYLRDFRYAQDAVALYEPVVQEFGYSMSDSPTFPFTDDE